MNKKNYNKIQKVNLYLIFKLKKEYTYFSI